MKTAAFALTLIGCMAWGALASPGRARADGDVAATALFDDGRKLMSQHRYAEACPKLAESQRLAPSGGTLINLAQCYEYSGQTASAWEAWKDAAARASSAGKDDAEKSALRHATALEPSLAKLTIAVDPASDVAGLEVKRDGTLLGHAEFGVPIPVDPGAHIVAASAPQKKAWSTTVNVAPKETGAQVTVSMADDAAPGVAAAPLAAPVAVGVTDLPSKAAEPTPAGSNGSTQRTLGWVTAGAGVVGIAIGSVFGLDAKSKNDEATNQDGCSGATCKGPNSAQGAAASSEASSAATASTIAFIVGGVALAAGVVILLTAPSGHAVQVAPTVGQSFGGLAAYGVW
jgi:hypothetical protein